MEKKKNSFGCYQNDIKKIIDKLPVNYQTSDFQLSYQKLREEIKLDNYFDYNRINDEKEIKIEYKGLLWFALNVQVLPEGGFIPFLYIRHSDSERERNLRDWANNTFREGRITYNFTDFLQEDFVKSIIKRYPHSELFFSVEKTEKRYLIKQFQYTPKGIIGANKENVDDSELLKINERLSNLDGNDFIQQLSCKYHEEGKDYLTHLNNNLWFAIYTFDSDYKTDTKLTNILVISETQEEIEYFVNHRIRQIRDLASLIRLRFIRDLFQKSRYEAIKSAISAIMSRNMSHNLGSHYLYYTKAYLEQLANNAGNIAPDIRGAAKVMGYIQARMDYLATVISNDKYPYGAVNFKSQIYDELTVDDFSHRHFFDDRNKRTTNFLLTNLIYSENFTRPDVRSDDELKEKSNQLFLHVKLLEEDKKFADFTGTWHSGKLQWVRREKKENRSLPTMITEETVKNQLSSLNIALPGGSMSCHALFNVIENFIRNSAKYLQNDINKENGLIFTIALSPNPSDKNYVEVTIYDNKKNANKIIDDKKGLSLYNQILEKLCSLIIIDEQNKISKEDKGFKEMLFSSIWMRAYTFGNDNTYADIVSKINSANNGEEKLSLIERHGFSLVRVAESQKGDITIYDRKNNYDGECNLGLQLKLPLFKQCDEIILCGDKAKDVDNILNMMSDIVLIDRGFLESEYHHVFTRPLLKDEASGLTMYERYHKVVSSRFPDIDKYSLSLHKAEDNYNYTPQNYQIYFKRHMSTSGNADPNEYMGYAYADTVSGGNFTITLLDLFNKGYENGMYKTDDDRIFALKIKESALTRVTVVDERLFKSTYESDYPWLSLKNVRVLNYNDSFDDTIYQETNNGEYDISKIFIGNTFREGDDITHFLTIHLGLIEKILKNSIYVNNLINKRLGVDNDGDSHHPLDSVRVRTFMRLLREHYSNGHTQNLYIAVHSGRGNYSAELEGPLSKYPFISLSALENAFNNSKYQLCQLLYNTVYIGKGFANNIK